MAGERYGFQEDMKQTWLGFQPWLKRWLLASIPCWMIAALRFLCRDSILSTELRGIAYEGAGMGLAILDGLFPWKKRLQAFLAGPAHIIQVLFI